MYWLQNRNELWRRKKKIWISIHMLQIMNRIVRGILRKAEVDRATFYSILQSVAQVSIGPLVAFLITTRFSSEFQGYYYTFTSFLILQVVAEFGFGQAIIQFASHEWSRLSITEDRRIIGDTYALSRLISLGHFSLKWYSIASLVCFGVLITIGTSFFVNGGNHSVEWFGPWIAFSVAAGLNLALQPIFCLLQGCNQVAEYWFYRFVIQALYGFVLCFAMIFGANLWSLSIGSFVCTAWGILFLWRRYPHVVSLLFSRSAGPQ